MAFKQNNKSLFLKVHLILCFLLLSFLYVQITSKSVPGYEFSIYLTDISPFFWVFFSILIISGLFIIVSSIVGIKENNWWKYGILLIVLSNLLVILIYFLRGYPFPAGGDHLTHVGIVKDILHNNTIPINLIYPTIHILITEIILMLNTSTSTICYFIGPIFYLLFILYTYLLSKYLLPFSAAVLATTASTILYCYYYIQIFPMGSAFITFPLIFYLYFKRLNGNFININICLLICLYSMVFFHPVSSFVLIISMLIMEFGQKIISIDADNSFRISTFNKPSYKISVIPSLILTISLILWIWTNYSVWNQTVSSVFSWFGNELLVEPMIGKAQEGFDKLGFSSLEIFFLFIKKFGHIFIYFALSIFAICIFFYNKISIGKKEKYSYLASYIIFFLMISVIWITDYVKPLTTLSSGRMIWIMTSLLPPLVGLAIYYFLHINKIHSLHIFQNQDIKNKYRSYIVIFIFAICLLIGVFSIHPSPFVVASSSELSEGMIDGPIWLMNNGNLNINVTGAGNPEFRRVSSAIYGNNYRHFPSWEGNVLDHFGYGANNSIGQTLNGERYLILRPDYLLQLYRDLFPTINRYTENDFDKLNSDSSACLIYDNNDTIIFHTSRT
ncbi:hypothetical protein [Methanohalophilus sp. WG1-DM]|uniref:hypothetical protein n=1 Tax=Methanohalophilus sp. WG1-DM TaxID=2491675 RepID=UPI000FFEAB68|nr:hypothetical protein [Methanohalophilus sp. WG1-DM]RXG33521.1 hypothetical protein CI957_1833 [Methanohalophilus sp. WG1-DM]